MGVERSGQLRRQPPVSRQNVSPGKKSAVYCDTFPASTRHRQISARSGATRTRTDASARVRLGLAAPLTHAAQCPAPALPPGLNATAK